MDIVYQSFLSWYNNRGIKIIKILQVYLSSHVSRYNNRQSLKLLTGTTCIYVQGYCTSAENIYWKDLGSGNVFDFFWNTRKLSKEILN